MWNRLFFIDLLESLAQNGKPPDENGGPLNGEEPSLRHRSRRDEAKVSQGPADSSKSYTAEQLEAVKKSVHYNLFFTSG